MPDDPLTSAFFAAHRGELVNYANRLMGNRAEAEDVVQEAYLRFDGASGDRLLKEPLRYFYRVVRNLAIDGLRRRSRESRHITVGHDEANHVATDRPSPEAELVAKDALRIVQRAMSDLPPATRTALQMHRLEGRKLKDIALHLGISTTHAHELVAQGIAHCRQCLRTKS